MCASRQTRIRAALLAALAVEATPALAPAHDIYWGDLHGHTMDSPVTLTPGSIDAYIRSARETRGLHFVALSEKDFDRSDTEWGSVRSGAAASTTSSFIAFSALEWGDDTNGSFGHRPTYYLTDNQPLFRSDNSSARRTIPVGDNTGEVEFEHDIETGRSGQLERPLEQPRGTASVAPPERPAAGSCKSVARTFGSSPT